MNGSGPANLRKESVRAFWRFVGPDGRLLWAPSIGRLTGIAHLRSMTSAVHVHQMNDNTLSQTPRTHAASGLSVNVVSAKIAKIKLARQGLPNLRAQMEDICSGK